MIVRKWFTFILFSLLTACYSAHPAEEGDPTENRGNRSIDQDTEFAPDDAEDTVSITNSTAEPQGSETQDSETQSATPSDPVDTGPAVDSATETAESATALDDTDSSASLCGNGVLDPGEECEDGNPDLPDQCDDFCRFEPEYPFDCGDGAVDIYEECDDGNRISGDGCSESCCIEPPWGPPCGEVYRPCHCGNGMIEPREACDDGNEVEGDGCSLCRIEPKGTCPNGVVDEFEECDDGNTDDNDGCDHLCRRILCVTVIVCGNGVLEPGEVCDDGNATGGDGCSAFCDAIEPGYQCPFPGEPCRKMLDAGNADDAGVGRCGDARTQRELGEECDDGENDGGYGECAPGCLLGPHCGDGVVNGPEICDDGINDGGYGECAPGCVLGPYCGDGIVQLGYEECEPEISPELEYCSYDCIFIGPTGIL